MTSSPTRTHSDVPVATTDEVLAGQVSDVEVAAHAIIRNVESVIDGKRDAVQTALTVLQEVEPPAVAPGSHAMTVVIEYPAGDPGAPPHRHPGGPAFGYVIEGEMLFELEGMTGSPFTLTHVSPGQAGCLGAVPTVFLSAMSPTSWNPASFVIRMTSLTSPYFKR